MINGSIKKTPFRVERRLVIYSVEIAMEGKKPSGTLCHLSCVWIL